MIYTPKTVEAMAPHKTANRSSSDVPATRSVTGPRSVANHDVWHE